MSMIKGMTVTLLERTQTGVDPFGAPIYAETETPIDDVLISPASSQDINDNQMLYGKRAVYTLAIPKGDDHEWEGRELVFFNRKWRAFGMVLEGIEENIPLRWTKKVQVEAYE